MFLQSTCVLFTQTLNTDAVSSNCAVEVVLGTLTCWFVTQLNDKLTKLCSDKHQRHGLCLKTNQKAHQ